MAKSLRGTGNWEYPTRVSHVIVLNETHLRRGLRSYVDYDHTWRGHRSLAMDAPVPRPVHPPELGDVRKLPEVGGLHHH